jgi:hypothetical protein
MLILEDYLVVRVLGIVVCFLMPVDTGEQWHFSALEIVARDKKDS